MKKLKKVFNVVIICLMILFFLLPISNATNKNFDLASFENGNSSSAKEVLDMTDKMLGTAISIVQIAGTGISITILIVIACKYMIASPGDRADIKKNAVPFVIGAVVLFGASNILAIIVEFASTIS